MSMENEPIAVESKSMVRVVPFDGGWAVQWEAGLHACPLRKSEAIAKASRIALEIGLFQVAIMGADGALEKLLPLGREDDAHVSGRRSDSGRRQALSKDCLFRLPIPIAS